MWVGEYGYKVARKKRGRSKIRFIDIKELKLRVEDAKNKKSWKETIRCGYSEK